MEILPDQVVELHGKELMTNKAFPSNFLLYLNYCLHIVSTTITEGRIGYVIDPLCNCVHPFNNTNKLTVFSISGDTNLQL